MFYEQRKRYLTVPVKHAEELLGTQAVPPVINTFLGRISEERAAWAPS